MATKKSNADKMKQALQEFDQLLEKEMQESEQEAAPGAAQAPGGGWGGRLLLLLEEFGPELQSILGKLLGRFGGGGQGQAPKTKPE